MSTNNWVPWSTTTHTLDAKNRTKTTTYANVTSDGVSLETPAVTYCYDGQSYDPGPGGCNGAIPRASDYSYAAMTDY